MAPPAPWAWRERKESIIKLGWNLVPFRFFWGGPLVEWPCLAFALFALAPAHEAKQSSQTLGVNAAQLEDRGYAVDRQHVSRDAVIDLVQFCVAHDLVEGILHNVHQPLVDLALPPEESLAVLHPLEVTHRHATGVAQNVGYGEDPFRIDDRIGLPGRRAVRAFTEDFRLDRKSTRLNSSHGYISYAGFCLKKKKHSDSRGVACSAQY